MNTKQKMIVVTMLGLLALIGNQVLAQGTPAGGGVPMALTVNLTAIIQGPDNGGDPIDKISSSTAKITTAWILKQLATAAGATLPTGAKLMMTPDGTVYVADSTGKDLSDTIDASGVTVSFDPDGNGGVWAGSINNETGKANYTGYYGQNAIVSGTITATGKGLAFQ